MKNKKRLITIILAFALFLVCFFVAGPWLQKVMESNQPYLIVDPEVKSETGCQYDYLTFIPVEVTGREPSEGIRFPVATIPADYIQYVHYPASWNAWWNPFNPANHFAQILGTVLRVLVGVLFVSLIAYFIILWRRGAIKKMSDRLK
jgi:hypothetical protein